MTLIGLSVPNIEYKTRLHKQEYSSGNKLLKNNFRYDINALRALAVLGVLFYHYKVHFLAGGFAGVDVFFVISGYLMTRIIFYSISQNQFSFKDYLDKRFKRIVPALIFLIFIVTVVGFFIYFPEDYKFSQRNAAASILFLSNILYWQDPYSYSSSASDSNIFLHTWSLSVEWQFYLLYPFGLLLLYKVFKSKQLSLRFFIGVTLLAFCFSIIFTNYKDSASFYLLPTRAWEMLVGGVAFFTEGLFKGYKWRKALATIGYIILLCCLCFLDDSLLWPGVYTSIPVFATYLVIIANQNDSMFIKNDVVQFFGKISYSLYLWHWPVYVIAQYYGIKVGLSSVALFTLLSIIIGYVSLRYIESIKISTAKLFFAVVSTTIICCCLSYLGLNGILYKKGTLEIANYESTHIKESNEQYSKGTCFVGDARNYNKNLCLCFEQGKKNILLIGDSHMGQLSQSLKERFKNYNIHFLQATAEGTLPTLKDFQHKSGNLRQVMDYTFLDFIPKNANHIDGVIISGLWDETNKIVKDSILLGIQETTAYLRKYKIETLIIGQTEHYSIPYAIIAARDFENNENSNLSYVESSAYEIDAYLSENLGLSYIKVSNQNSFPRLSHRDEPYMTDKHHVTKYGADLIVDKIMSDPYAINFFTSRR